MTPPSASAANPVVILGAGPSGLAAAWELSRAGRSCVVLEKDEQVGGLAATVKYKGYGFDIGGHRFFTKSPEVQAFWIEILGEAFLRVRRLSRIYYKKRFFHYPLKPFDALLKLGPVESARCLFSYIRQKARPHADESNLERWVANRFGERLYQIFFKTYTEKVWGIPCSEISAEWGAQRIKGMSLSAVIKTMLAPRGSGQKIKSLIEEFRYPERGPGQLYEILVELLAERGSATRLRTPARRIEHDAAGRVTAVVAGEDETARRWPLSDLITSIPISELIQRLDPPAPEPVRGAAERLRYRDLLVVNLILDQPDLFPDNWLYIHDPEVHVGRIQNYKNWSSAMTPDPTKTSLGMEYFCTRGDGVWSRGDEDLLALAEAELKSLGLGRDARVVDGFVVRRENAYCVHDTRYQEDLDVIRAYLSGFSNLQTVGRAGMFKYNNQDHAIMTGLLAARNLLGAQFNVWAVNVDAEYLEEEALDSAETLPAQSPYFRAAE